MNFEEQKAYLRERIRQMTNDPWLIDELTHVATIKVHTSTCKVQTPNQYMAWLTFIAKSVYIDHYRKLNSNKRKAFVQYEADGVSSFNPESRIIDKEIKDELIHFIDKLPYMQRATVIFRYYCDFSFGKISELLGCSYNTSLSYMHNAKRNLRKMYAGEYDYDSPRHKNFD